MDSTEIKNIESRIFGRKRFARDLLTEYGFRVSGGVSRYETFIMSGDLKAVIEIGEDSKVRGVVMDPQTEDEFTQFRAPVYNGTYVNSVRSEYEDLLNDIAAKCCTDVLFASDQSNRITNLIAKEYGVAPDFPWSSDDYGTAGVVRHSDTGKWFGLIMNIKRKSLAGETSEELVDVINLKIAEEDGEILKSEDGIYPAFHMNHRLWISAVLDDTLSDEKVMELIGESFRLTDRKKKAPAKK